MKKIGIVGYGRFGELLASLSKDMFDVYVVESNKVRSNAAKSSGCKILNFEDLSLVDFIFLAIPISEVEKTVIKLAPFVRADQVVIDLCSVKVYPANILRKYLKNCQLLATHPMFGPDSARNGLAGLTVAICPININPANLKIIEDFWASCGATPIKTTPEKHDKDSVYSQAFTYSLAKLILSMNLGDITFSIRSYDAIREVARLSANDTNQLFHDVLFYNPYFSDMKAELEASINKTSEVLKSIESEQKDSKIFE